MDVPLPTAAEAGSAFVYFSSQAGLLNAVLVVIIIALCVAGFFIVKMCRADMASAWARVTQISEARTADSKAGDEAIYKNTLALTIVAERLNNRS